MTRLVLFGIGLVAVGLVGVAAEEPKPADVRKQAADDLNAMQGTWMRVAMEVEGQPFPLDPAVEWTATYKGDLLTLAKGGKPYQANSIVTLDPGRTPKAVNTWSAEGDTKDQTWPGIYKLAGDTMTICFARPGEGRPTEFSTKAGGYLLAVYKRRP